MVTFFGILAIAPGLVHIGAGLTRPRIVRQVEGGSRTVGLHT